MNECLTREQWYETSTFPSGVHFLKQTVVIEGVTGAEIKKWVNLIPSRRDYFLTREQIEAKGFPSDILDRLVKAGMVEKKSNSFHDYLVTLTDFGRDLKRAVWCPNFQIKRNNVPQILEKVKVAVRTMNEKHSCHISYIWLFGSYVSSRKQLLSDIDVALD